MKGPTSDEEEDTYAVIQELQSLLEEETRQKNILQEHNRILREELEELQKSSNIDMGGNNMRSKAHQPSEDNPFAPRKEPFTRLQKVNRF